MQRASRDVRNLIAQLIVAENCRIERSTRRAISSLSSFARYLSGAAAFNALARAETVLPITWHVGAANFKTNCRSVGRLAPRRAPPVTLVQPRRLYRFVSRYPPRARRPLVTLVLARLSARRLWVSAWRRATRPRSDSLPSVHGTYVGHAPGPSWAVAARVRILRDFSPRRGNFSSFARWVATFARHSKKRWRKNRDRYAGADDSRFREPSSISYPVRLG